MTLYPCPRCGAPYSMFDPAEWHIDPPVCRKCWKEIKPEFIQRMREINAQFSGSQEKTNE